MKFQFLPENFSRSENAPPFETRKIRQFEVERIFLKNKKMVEEIPTSAGRGRGRGGYSNFRKNLMVAGAGGPDALQTSSPVRRPKLVVSFSACGPPGLTLPGCARQLLNRRSGSAQLRSTASQSLLAALRNAKQFSLMRSRR